MCPPPADTHPARVRVGHAFVRAGSPEPRTGWLDNREAFLLLVTTAVHPVRRRWQIVIGPGSGPLPARSRTVPADSWACLAGALEDPNRQPSSVASGIEVDEGRWGRSEGHIGSMKVERKSVWLLHLAAALTTHLGLAT